MTNQHPARSNILSRLWKAGPLLAINAVIFIVISVVGGIRPAILIVMGVGLLLSSVTAVVLVNRHMGQVGKLARSINEQISSGNFDISIPEKGDDELHHLSTAVINLGKAYRRSVNELGKRAEELAALNLLAETINRTFDLQEVLNVSLREVLRTTRFPKGAIFMWDDRTETLTMVSYVGLSDDALRQFITRKKGEGLVGGVAESQDMIIVREGDKATYPETKADLRLAIPLETPSGDLLGVLTIGGLGSQPLTQDQRKLIITSAYQIALAIDKARLYEEVRLHAEQLEQKVEARTTQLNRAVEKLSVALERAHEADRVKSMLLSTVSHELRTPLMTIKGNTSLLREHHARIDPDTLVEHLVDIDEETDKLTDLISNLLDMSRIEAGILTITPTPFDLCDVVESAVHAAQMRSASHQFELAACPEKLPFAYGDPRRIEQVLANLLDNAMKYSEAGTQIHTEVVVDEGDMLTVKVTDEGQGISPEKLAHIFDRFFQVDGAGDSIRNGVGLGLAICKGLIDSHDGKIWVESQLGEGSTFAFSIPTVDISILNSNG